MKTIKINNNSVPDDFKDVELVKVKDIKKLIDEIDVELFLTDIKDKQGNKIEISDEIMEIIRIWWEQKSVELKQKLEVLK